MIKHIHSDIYAVNLPDDVINPVLIQSHSYFHTPRIEHGTGGIDLPQDAQWKYLCLSTTQKEEEAARVVEYNYKPFDPSVIRYENYDSDGWTIGQRHFRTAIQSLSSMNKAFELSGTWALIQKEK
jgi:hypothetical protein